MKIDYVLLSFAVASVILGFVLIVLGNISPWSKNNFVYVMGVMILILGMICIVAGILLKGFLGIFFKSWLLSFLCVWFF